MDPLYIGQCAICGAETIVALDGMGNLICEDCKNDEVLA